MLTAVLRYPVVPVFYHADAAYVRHLLQTCYAGGVRVFEFTNRGENAFQVFAELATFVRDSCPELMLGIGTIYQAEEAERFIAAGADFVVQPVTTDAVGSVCRRNDVAWVPGAMTLNEIYQASRLGAALVKVFPGNALGAGYIKSLRGPLPDVKLMVTGGVEPTRESLSEWFGAGVNVVGIGSQLFKNADDTEALSRQIIDLMAFVNTLKT